MSVQVSEEPLQLKYDLQHTIGSGAYGKCLLACRRGDQKQVVVKQIILRNLGQQAKEEALKEAQLLAQFDHINIIHYYECVLEGDVLNIVMEYASEGDLAAVILQRAQEKKPFNEHDIMIWFVQIVLALFHVHSKNTLHRDLKSQNIFISSGNILKLGDFGISKVLSTESELAHTVIGTPYYLSPEICEDQPYDRKSDVWALGCILYELCTLKRAFNGHSLPALVVQILRGRYPPVPTRYSSGLRSLVDAMLKVNPKERISVEAILRLSFVRRYVEQYAQHVMQLSPLDPKEVVGPGLTVIDNKFSNPSDGVAAPSAEAVGAMKGNHAPGVTPSPGQSPAKGRKPAAGKLGLNTWMGKQQAELAELQGALALQGVGANRRPVQRCQPPQLPQPPVDSAVAEPRRDSDAVSTPGHDRQQGLPTASRQLSGTPASPATKTTAVSAVQKKAAVAGRPQVRVSKQAAREAELEVAKKAVNQERARKADAAKQRSQQAQQAADHVRQARKAELQRLQNEQKNKEAERAARASELAEHMRARQANRCMIQEQLAVHMAAHQQHVKQAKARISRAELAQMGAEFAARQQQLVAHAEDGGEALIVVVNQQEPITAADAQPPASQPANPAAVVPRQISQPPPPQQGAPQLQTPPWKARKGRQPDTPEGPAIQIYAPFGSANSPDKAKQVVTESQPTPERPARRLWQMPEVVTKDEMPNIGAQSVPLNQPQQDESLHSQGNATPLGTGWESSELLGLLSEIQEVLAPDSDDEGSPAGRLSPTTDDGPTAMHTNTVTAADQAMHAVGRPSHQGIEQLRLALEKELGPDIFITAYRHCKAQTQYHDNGNAPLPVQHRAMSPDQLLPLLQGKTHVIRQLHRLIMWEDQVFG